MDAKMTAIARRARQSGTDAERELALACPEWVLLERIETPMMGWGATARAIAGAGCDFRFVLPGGRAGVIEVKSTKARSLPLRVRGGMLRPPQVEQLGAYAKQGALGLVVVRTRVGWWWLSYADWVSMLGAAGEAGAKSISQEDLQWWSFHRAPDATWPTSSEIANES